MHGEFERLKRRLVELITALERGDLEARALESAMYSARIEFERVQSNALGHGDESREELESDAQDVQRLVAVALDLASRRKDGVGDQLARLKKTDSRLRYYGDSTERGASCDLDG